MRAVIAHVPETDVRLLRRVLHGVGADCAADDCVGWDNLDVRLARGDVELVVVKIEPHHEPDWGRLGEALSLSGARKIAVGPQQGPGEAHERCQQIGISEYLDDARLREQLDSLFERLNGHGPQAAKHGTIISVLAPTPGSGGSTVAMNLSGALAKNYPGQVALVDLDRDASDMSLLLHTEVSHSLRELCRRWQSLDCTSLRNGGGEYRDELKLLVNRVDEECNEFLHVQSLRRIGVLARVAFSYTVFALGNQLGDVEIEALRLTDKIVLVVRPDVPAVRRAATRLEELVALGVPRERFHLVVNRWGQGGQLKLEQVESALDMKTHLQIPDDPSRVNTAVNRGVLLHELTGLASISRRFAKLARSLNGNGKAHGKAWRWLP